jgi:predicted nucleic acid-binding Zn ribbon protein
VPADDPAADLARSALARARSRGGGPRRRPGAQQRPRPAGGDGDREPALLGDALAELVADRGWTDDVSAAGVVGRWEQIAGPDLAAHCRAESLDDRTLVVVAESTAWATQLRLLERVLLQRIAEAAGPGVVARLLVRGPVAPDWRHGPRRIRGRGPRDTYG